MYLRVKLEGAVACGLVTSLSFEHYATIKYSCIDVKYVACRLLRCVIA